MNEQPKLTVTLHSFPETNCKRNWTAMIKRTEKFDGLVGSAGGIVVGYGEYVNRVVYNAERARFLLGERKTEPYILHYGSDVKTLDEFYCEDSECAFSHKG